MFDKKAWREANSDKCKLYSVRYRLRQKGLESPETTEQLMAEREAKKVASAERAKIRKREWAAANKHRKNERYRERYHNDPEFRRREIDKRIAAFSPKMTEEEREALRAKKLAEKMALKQAQLESRQHEREQERLKKKKLENAKRHMLALAKAEKIPPKKPKVTMKVRKPGRLVALSGWMGW